jgi:hypothetical protein
MKEFEYCSHCSKKLRLSEDVGLGVYVGNQEFLCRLILIVSEETKMAESKSCELGFTLYSWSHRVSFKEKMLRWELESKVHEAEDEAFREEVGRLRGGGSV